MRAVVIAAAATALMATALSPAAADQIITESFSVTIPNSVVPSDPLTTLNFNSTPFPLFAPTTGTLDSVNVTVAGSVTIVSLIADPDVGIFLWGDTDIDGHPVHTAGSLTLKLSGNDTSGFYLGTGNGTVQIRVGSGDVTPNASLIASDGPLNGVITYTYAPRTLAAIPEASTWAAMLVGFASLGFAGRRAMGKGAVRA